MRYTIALSAGILPKIAYNYETVFKWAQTNRVGTMTEQKITANAYRSASETRLAQLDNLVTVAKHICYLTFFHTI